MPETFAGDIIVFGAIALFIILRYRSTLGQKKGDDFTKPKPPIVLSEKTPVVQLQDKRAVSAAGNDNHEKPGELLADPKLASQVAQIKVIDTEFTISSFMAGARGAYEMVIQSFSKQDKETLKLLLSKDLYKDFAKELEEQDEKKQKRETTLVALSKAEITEIDVKKNQAVITVKFTSEQVSIVRDKDGAIVEGDASAVLDMEDSWVFERDLKSRNPNWTIIDT